MWGAIGLNRNSESSRFERDNGIMITTENAFILVVGVGLMYAKFRQKIQVPVPGGGLVVGTIGAVLTALAALSILA